jgi:hypothetical protein
MFRIELCHTARRQAEASTESCPSDAGRDQPQKCFDI